jgi:hypothetical protein
MSAELENAMERTVVLGSRELILAQARRHSGRNGRSRRTGKCPGPGHSPRRRRGLIERAIERGNYNEAAKRLEVRANHWFGLIRPPNLKPQRVR